MSQLLQGKTEESTDGSLVPDHYLNGFGFEPDGALAVDSAGAIDYYHEGLPFTAEGRLCVEDAAVSYYGSGAAPFTASGRVASGSGAIVSYLGGVPYASGGGVLLGEGASSVAKPTNTTPANGATDVVVTPTLTASAFAFFGEAQTHANSQWQVASDSGFSSLEWDSGVSSPPNTSIVVPALDNSKLLYWRVRYSGSATGFSPWSAGTSFTTEAAATVNTPANVSPADAAIDQPLLVTVTSSAFGTTGGAQTHVSSRWQASLDGNFTNPAWDSGNDAVNLLSYTAVNPLTPSTVYYWRVLYTGSVTGDSEWSVPTVFTTVVAAIVDRPANVSPANGATDVVLSPTLGSSAFSVTGPAQTHDASQWQVTLQSDPTFASPVWDSGTDAVNLVSVVVGTPLGANNVYIWRVRYQGSTTGFSDYSAPTNFLTEPAGGEYVQNVVDNNGTFVHGSGVTYPVGRSNKATCSFWAANKDTYIYGGLVAWEDATQSEGFRVVYDGSKMRLTMRSNNVEFFRGNWQPMTINNYNHILISVDGLTVKGYVNNVPVTGLPIPSSSDGIDYAAITSFSIPLSFGPLNQLSDVWFMPGVALDFDQPSERAKFIDQTTLKPVSLGTNGELPTGTAPPTYLGGSMKAAQWNNGDNLGNGGGTTVVDGPGFTDASTPLAYQP